MTIVNLSDAQSSSGRIVLRSFLHFDARLARGGLHEARGVAIASGGATHDDSNPRKRCSLTSSTPLDWRTNSRTVVSSS